MHIVFLRGSVPPTNEHPEKLYYKTVEECEDMWTQLFYYLLQKSGSQGELLYVNGSRHLKVNNFFQERWVCSLKDTKISSMPDLIICRGGFPYYDDFVKRFPKAKKIYYGAGKRFFPQTSYTNYDLFLVDSETQLKKVKAKGKKNVKLLIKPAATLFKPMNIPKKYDICFMANASTSRIKRHELILKSFARSRYSILNIGNTDKKFIRMAKELKVNIEWAGWHLRKELPKLINQCRVGICCSTNYDSCPRVIPEYLACNVPVIATKNINFWHKKYINKNTGVLVDDNKLISGVDYCIAHKIKPYQYYNKNLSMKKAARYLLGLIKEL